MRLSTLVFAYTGSAFCSAAAIAASSSHVLLPKPTGLYQVGISTAELIDNKRTQPFAPDTEPRRLMISMYYPVVPQYPPVTGAYMPPAIARVEDLTLSSYGLKAPNGTFEKVLLNLASDKPYQNLTHQGLCHHPLVIFMPAEGTTRFFYNQIVSTIASNGYIVASIDPPYDVDVVEFPDGSIATYNTTLWNNPNETALAPTGYLAIATRAQDVSFVLDSLANTTLAHSLVPNLPASGLDTTHTAMFGGSLGGSTAFSILAEDARVLGGLDMDGGLYGPGLDKGTSKPFMFMGRVNHTRENLDTDPFLTWGKVWPKLTGFKRHVIVSDFMHYDFSDYPVLFDTLGITPSPQVGLQTEIQIGAAKGPRALQIVTSYIGAFLDFVIYGKCSALLDGPSAEFPEVTFEF